MNRKLTSGGDLGRFTFLFSRCGVTFFYEVVKYALREQRNYNRRPTGDCHVIKGGYLPNADTHRNFELF